MLKHDAIDVYVADGCGVCDGGNVGFYLSDKKCVRRAIEKMEHVSGCGASSKVEKTLLLRFHNDGSDVGVFDLVGLHGKEVVHVDGVCDMMDVGGMSADWVATAKRGRSAHVASSVRKNVMHGYVKGRISDYDPKCGIGFVFADNEYADGEPPVYYARIETDGSFVFDISVDRPRIFFARMGYLKGMRMVTFVVMPGQTTAFCVGRGECGLYDVHYDNSMCKENVVGENFLHCYHDYSVRSPYERGNGFDATEYELQLY